VNFFKAAAYFFVAMCCVLLFGLICFALEHVG
jgi:hypothetical protein